MEKDKNRGERIMMEVVVDAYNKSERAMGWYYYLSDTFAFPFNAERIDEHPASPLLPGEKVEVSHMPEAGICEYDMLVTIRWQDRTFAVPWAQLNPVDVDEATQQVVDDWHYWVARKYEF